jgi:hypothetical protein
MVARIPMSHKSCEVAAVPGERDGLRRTGNSCSCGRSSKVMESEPSSRV